MLKDPYFESIIERIEEFLDNNRATSSISDCFSFIVYTLYGIHKQYGTIEKSDDSLFFYNTKDELLKDLYSYCQKKRGPKGLYILYKQIFDLKFRCPNFDKIYIEVLTYLFDKKATFSDHRGETYTPTSINKLLAYYINNNNCNSVYDPFCGTASIARYIKNSNVSFVGQDNDYESTLYARVNMEYRYGKDSVITCGDSMYDWNSDCYESVISCPPFNLTTSFYGSRILLEDIYFKNAFTKNKAKLVITLEPLSFCFSSRYRSVRKYLVDNNFLDTIITFPGNMLYGTSVPCVLIICKKSRTSEDKVKFIDADSFIRGNNNRVQDFKVDEFILYLESNKKNSSNSTNEEIVNFDYNLNSSLYNYEMIELEDGQELKLLGQLFSEATFERTSSQPGPKYIYPSNYLNSNIIDVWQTKGKELEKAFTAPSNSKIYHSSNSKSFLLHRNIPVSNSGLVLGLYKGTHDFICQPSISVLQINEKLVLPEYLVYLILSHPAIKKGGMPLKEYFLLPVAVDSLKNQKVIVEKIKQEYALRVQAEQAADLQRLGVKQNISDLEHMLGSTKIKIDNVIDRLGRMTPSSQNYVDTVKQLKDNVAYMFRVIHYNNSSIDSESLYLTSNSILSFLNEYAKAWSNY